MSDTPGSLMRRAATAACLTLHRCRPNLTHNRRRRRHPSPDFLTRYDFHLSANALAIDDPRFSWDAYFGGDVDSRGLRRRPRVGAGRLPGDSRRRVPPVRSEPGVLRARGVVVVSARRGRNRRRLPSRVAASQRSGEGFRDRLERRRRARVAPLRGGRRHGRRLWRRRRAWPDTSNVDYSWTADSTSSSAAPSPRASGCSCTGPARCVRRRRNPRPGDADRRADRGRRAHQRPRGGAGAVCRRRAPARCRSARLPGAALGVAGFRLVSR